jgi:hypothetical protein
MDNSFNFERSELPVTDLFQQLISPDESGDKMSTLTMIESDDLKSSSLFPQTLFLSETSFFYFSQNWISTESFREIGEGTSMTSVNPWIIVGGAAFGLFLAIGLFIALCWYRRNREKDPMVADYEIETEFREEAMPIDESKNEPVLNVSFDNSEEGAVLAEEWDLLRFNEDESQLGFPESKHLVANDIVEWVVYMTF